MEEFIATLSNDELNGDFEEIYKRAPHTKETMCGFGWFKGRRLQGWVYYCVMIAKITWYLIIIDLQTKRLLCLFSVSLD